VFEARFLDVVRVNHLVPRLAVDRTALVAEHVLTTVDSTATQQHCSLTASNQLSIN